MSRYKFQTMFVYKRSSHIIYIFFLILINSFVQATPKNDSLPNNPHSNTTILEIKDADKIFKQSDHDWWDKYSNAIIAFFTVLGSAYISYKIASKQTALTKEQLDLTKKQMEENYRVAIAQVKANNISAARIEWIQKLRPLLAELLSKTTLLDEKIKILNKPPYNKNPEELTEEEFESEEKLYDEMELISGECEIIWNQIQLFLNKKEKEHAELIECYKQFIVNMERRFDNKKITKLITEEMIVDKSHAILKSAWEQAKNIS